MNKMQEQVREFHREVLQGPTSPAMPKIRNGELRANLMLEEPIETVVALVGRRRAMELVNEYAAKLEEEYAKFGDSAPNLVEAADGIADTLVVTLGTAEDIGIDIDPYFDEVMKTNMAKKDGPVRPDGKKLKPIGWVPPDLATLLQKDFARHRDDSAGGVE